MSEIDQFHSARKQLRKATDAEIYSLREKLFSFVPELSWINKAVESALFNEIFWRTGRVDEGLFSRVIHTVENIEVFDELKPINPELPSSLEISPKAQSSTVLFLSSKFGNFVSSQEYNKSVLGRLNPQIDVKLASRKPIDSNYSKRFDSHKVGSTGDLRNLCKMLRVEKVVDLSLDHTELLRSVAGEIHIADLYGLPGLRADSALGWNEMKKYHRHLQRAFVPEGAPLMFLPPVSSLRDFPEIRQRHTDASKPIRLGAFCRTAKLNLRVINIWAEFMVRYTNSTLEFAFIQSNPNSQAFVRKIFEERGVLPERISFLQRMDTTTYLDKLNDIDINLGAMPEQGGISCMDSLSMGCPYPVCEDLSNTYTAAVILRHLGLDEWESNTVDEYQALLDTMVANICLTSTKDFRNSIRGRLFRSPLSAPDGVADVWRKFLRVV